MEQNIKYSQDGYKSMNLDYDLVSLTNTLAYSFDEGLSLASDMLNSPIILFDNYNHTIKQTDIGTISDPVLDKIVKTRFFSSTDIVFKENIHLEIVPNHGKMMYYLESGPSERTKVLAGYIARLLFADLNNQYSSSDNILNKNKKNDTLFHLLNNHPVFIDKNAITQMNTDLPSPLQILVCFRNEVKDTLKKQISSICKTDYYTVYKNNYLVFLCSALDPEQFDSLSDLLCISKTHGGLSFPFSDTTCYPEYVLQAIVTLNGGINNVDWMDTFLFEYEMAYAFDVISSYSSNRPLTTFRHPIFLDLESYDSIHNSDLYDTLLAFIFSSFNTVNASKRLSMHRNSILYRIKKIQEITGYDVLNSSNRTFLSYAAVIEKVIHF